MIEDVASLCEDLGHDVREAAPDIDADEVADVFLELAAAAVRRVITAVQSATGRPANRDTLEATTLKILQYGESRTAADLLDAFDALHRISLSLGKFFLNCDVWLSPTATIPPPHLGYFNADDPALSAKDWIAKFLTACPYTAMFNQSGQPAMSVPLHWSADGLPIGSHFAAHLGAEETLFSLAGQLERARPWARRRPKVHVASADAAR
jgi:amidase